MRSLPAIVPFPLLTILLATLVAAVAVLIIAVSIFIEIPVHIIIFFIHQVHLLSINSIS